MKIGIVADIHADCRALESALRQMPEVETILCAGDAVSEYRFCPETVSMLQEAGVRCVQGNHERVLFGGRNPQYLGKCRSRFAPSLLDVLADAPESYQMQAGNARILMVHGSPWRPLEDYVLPGSPDLSRFSGLPFDFVILGHTHVPLVHRANGVTVINPGSCSEPRGAAQQGSFAVLDTRTAHVEICFLKSD